MTRIEVSHKSLNNDENDESRETGEVRLESRSRADRVRLVIWMAHVEAGEKGIFVGGLGVLPHEMGIALFTLYCLRASLGEKVAGKVEAGNRPVKSVE